MGDRLGSCHHPKCNLHVAFGRLACPSHWFALPRPLQRLIYSAWDDRISGLDEGAHEHWKAEAVRWWMGGVWTDKPFVPAPSEP